MNCGAIVSHHADQQPPTRQNSSADFCSEFRPVSNSLIVLLSHVNRDGPVAQCLLFPLAKRPGSYVVTTLMASTPI